MEIPRLNVYKILNRTLRSYELPILECADVGSENIEAELAQVIENILSSQADPARFMHTFFRNTGRDNQPYHEQWQGIFGTHFAETVRDAFGRHSRIAQAHLTHYTFRRFFGKHTQVQVLGKGLNDPDFSIEYRLGPKVVLESGVINFSDADHIKSVVQFASLDEAVTLSELYETLPIAQAVVLSCVADWANNPHNIHDVRKIATRLSREPVKTLAEGLLYAEIDPTMPLYCIGEIADKSLSEEACDRAANVGKTYIRVPATERVSAVQMVLKYLANVFLTPYNNESILSPEEKRDTVRRIYDEAFYRIADLFTIKPIVERIRILRNEYERNMWCALVKGVGMASESWNKPLTYAAEVFDVYVTTPLFDTAIELFLEAAGVYDNKDELITAYLTSDPVKALATLSQDHVHRMFLDYSILKHSHPQRDELVKMSSEEVINAERATIMYRMGWNIINNNRNPADVIQDIEELTTKYAEE